MKIIPVRELIHDQRLLRCDDSIVGGTQFEAPVRRRSIFAGHSLDFPRSHSGTALAGWRAIKAMEGKDNPPPSVSADPGSPKYEVTVERICHRIGLPPLQCQRLDDLVQAIVRPKDKLRTCGWDGTE